MAREGKMKTRVMPSHGRQSGGAFQNGESNQERRMPLRVQKMRMRDMLVLFSKVGGGQRITSLIPYSCPFDKGRMKGSERSTWNKARAAVIRLPSYTGVHIIHVQRIYLDIRPMCQEIDIFFITENYEYRNLDGFLFLEMYGSFMKFCHHTDPEKMLLTPSQNLAKIHGEYNSCSVFSIVPTSLSPGRNSSREC